MFFRGGVRHTVLCHDLVLQGDGLLLREREEGVAAFSSAPRPWREYRLM